MKIKFLAIMLLAAFATACVTKEAPSEIGERLTPEQIASLSAPGAADIWNGKLVSVQGYPDYNTHLIKMSQRNMMTISPAPDSKEVLIKAKIVVVNADKVGTRIYGTADRNEIRVTSDDLELKNAGFLLDDYSTVEYGELLYSGMIVYDGSDYWLEGVTIHKAQ